MKCRGLDAPGSRERLFVYGSLKFHKIQRRAFGAAVSGTCSSLEGYARTRERIADGTYFVIRPKRGARVSGYVLLLTPAQLARADAYENGYVRKMLSLVDDTRAWVYLPAR